MYAYFIDDWVQRKHHRKLDRLDLGLTQKGIVGRKIQLSRLHDLPGSIKDCLAQGIKTLVSVGNDTTASRVANSAISIQKSKDGGQFSFSFAAIPIEEPSVVSGLFGYQTIQKAVDALAAHRTIKMDLGLLNNRHYFITAAVFPKKCSFRFMSYTISSLYNDYHVSVCNSDIYNNSFKDKKFSVSDGVLEAVIAHRPPVSFFERMRGSKQGDYIPDSVFPIKSIVIKSKQKTITVFADTEKQMTTPVDVEIAPSALESVVGDNFYGTD